METYKLLKDYRIVNVVVKKGSSIAIAGAKVAQLMAQGFIEKPKAPVKAKQKEK